LRLKVTGNFGPCKQAGNPDGSIERIVEGENKIWRVTQLNLPRDHTLEEKRASLEGCDHFCCIRSGERRHESGSIAQISTHPDFGHGYAGVLNHRVAASAFAKNFRQSVPDFFPDPKLALARLSLDPPCTELRPVAAPPSHAQIRRHSSIAALPGAPLR
jgi:hypothetical protein